MRLPPFLAVTTSVLLTLLVSSCDAQEDVAAQETVAMTQAQQIQQLKAHIEHLTKQVAVLNRNQKSIADKIGLTKPQPQQQPVIDIGNSASLGDDNAKVVLVEFTDLHCPFCKKFHQQRFPELEKEFIDTGKLRFVSKHYPILQLHKNAAVAAFSLECAREEGAYEKAKDWLFARGREFSKNDTAEFTQTLGLNSDEFNQCITSPATAAQINNDMKIAKLIGIKQTPSFVIGLQKNGQVVDWKIITGSQSIENFSKAIAEFTKLAETNN